MKKYTRNLTILLTLAVLLLVSLGCSNFGFQDGAITMDVTLNADTLNKIVSSVGIDSDNFVGKVQKIELVEPNIMRVTGEYKLLNEEKSGTIDFAITKGDNGVQVNVVDSTIPGLDENSPAVKSFNDTLGTALNAFASEKNQGATGITDIKVKDGKLVLTLSVKVK
jgi:hypothetical protein